MSFLPNVSSFTTLLETSFELMSRECPEAYLRICQLLSSHEVCLTIDVETVSIRFHETDAEILCIPEQPTVYLSSTKAILLKLVDAHYTLEYAIVQDYLHVRGKIDDVIRFYESFQIYIHGAVRCPSFPVLLTDYRYCP